MKPEAAAKFQSELIRLSFAAQLQDLEILLVRGLCRMLGGEAGALVLSDDEDETLYIKKTLVNDARWNYQMLTEVRDSLLGEILSGEEIIVAENLHQDTRYRASIDSFTGLTPHTMVCLPLRVAERGLGGLLIYNLPAGSISTSDLEMLSAIAETGAQAIEGARLLQRQRVTNADLEASQHELLRSRNTLRALFDSMPAALYIVDHDHKLVALNMACARRTEQFPSSLVGQPCYQALYRLSEPCPECRVLETLSGGEVTTRVVRRWISEEETNEWEISTYPILDEKDRVAQAIVLEQDITEKRRLESILAQSEKLAAVGQLAASVAHEINNPLTAIIANAQILQRELPPNDELQESVELIARAGTRATHVVRNLLDFARKERYYMAVTDINETIRKSVDLVQHELVARSIRLDFTPDPSLPRIRASQDHLQGVWLNMLMNAIDAIENKKGRIHIRTFAQNQTLKVCIRDSGKGIPPDRLERIFEPFYTTKPPGRGTGLGLSVCQRVIKQHGGHITVQSRVGEGTQFEISLPLKP